MGKLLNLDPLVKGVGKVFGGGDEGAISAVLDPGNLRDKITGKSEKEAGAKKAAAATDAAEIINQQTEKARADIFKLFPAAQQDLRGGFQGALDVFSQSLPAQQNIFQQGNVGAQQQLLAGLPQIQNAILGGQIDLSQLQPTQLQTPDLGFFQQQLPQFVNPFPATQEDVIGPMPVNPDPVAALGAGTGGFVGPNIGGVPSFSQGFGGFNQLNRGF